MKHYSIKIVLRGVSPMIWRRLKLSGDTSLASLHYIIQIVNGWDDDYLHQFHIYGQDYAIPREGGISCEDARSVRLDNFGFDIGDRFTYEYNFFAYWLFDIRIEAIEERPTTIDPPVCTSGKQWLTIIYGLMALLALVVWTVTFIIFLCIRAWRTKQKQYLSELIAVFAIIVLLIYSPIRQSSIYTRAYIDHYWYEDIIHKVQTGDNKACQNQA